MRTVNQIVAMVVYKSSTESDTLGGEADNDGNDDDDGDDDDPVHLRVVQVAHWHSGAPGQRGEQCRRWPPHA